MREIIEKQLRASYFYNNLVYSKYSLNVIIKKIENERIIMSFSIKGIIKFLTILSIIITLLISIKNEYLNKPRLKTTVTHGVVTNYVPNSKLKPYYGLIELHFENLSDKPIAISEIIYTNDNQSDSTLYTKVLNKEQFRNWQIASNDYNIKNFNNPDIQHPDIPTSPLLFTPISIPPRNVANGVIFLQSIHDPNLKNVITNFKAKSDAYKTKGTLTIKTTQGFFQKRITLNHFESWDNAQLKFEVE
ncbi:hypothetical protein [Phascolarctobacterium faecium]|uniref:hypothetical protein n=1 Tax=Phascolarctobacterium faecium TaxID=33025 RepID=UPI002672EB04|nr:hypothetical protein [Phascolarctobacterium faecium]